MVASLVVATFCCGFVLSGSFVSADDSYNADVSLTIPVACTMTGTVDTPHTANIEAGTYTADIGTTTLKTVCNDGNGFSIYAIGYSGLEYGNNKMLATVGGVLTPSYDIATGTATSGDTSNWAMKLNAVTGTYAPTLTNGFGSYRTVPTEYTKVATLLSGTDATIGSSVQSTYAVYVTSLQPAGSYNGKVKYTLVHPNDADAPAQPQNCGSNYICYFTNASGVTDTMGDQSISVSATSATLWASNFQREGYGFAGWSETFDYSDPTKFHGPNETISFTAGQYSEQNDGLSLYAIWVQNAGDLQNWNGCSNLVQGAITALTDTRDNNTYAVAKLVDGNCWMMENLRLSNVNSNNQTITFSSTNTNNPASGFAMSASQNPTSTAWCTTDDSACDDQPMLFTGNTANPASNITAMDDTVPVYSYGNYYNWYSATAGQGTYSNSSGAAVDGDICPAGWHLPYGWNGSGTNGGNTKGGFYYLGSALGATASNATSSNIWRSYPQNFVYSGCVSGSATSNRSLNGYYLSSTATSNSSNANNLLFSNSIFRPGTYYNTRKNIGQAVRCVINDGS